MVEIIADIFLEVGLTIENLLFSCVKLSQLFPAIFEFCNGGRPKPEIIAQLITLLVDIKT